MKPIIQVLLLLLHLSVHGAQGGTDPAETAIEFKALCRLTKLLETPVIKSSPDPKVEAEVQEILKLNMSAAPESWRVNFGDNSAKRDGASIKGNYNSEPYDKGWEGSGPDWPKKASAIAPTDTSKRWLEKHTRTAAAQIAAAQLKPLAAKAKELQAAYVAQYKVEVKDKEDLAEAKLKAALTEVHSTKGEDFDTFAEENKAARTNADCNGHKTGQGVLYDIACLCIGAATKETTGCIGGTLSKAWSANKGDLAAAMAELKSHCGQGFKPTLAADALTAAVGAVENLIGRRGTTTVGGDKLGKSNSADCTGAADKVCVRYEEYYSSTATTPKQQKVPWMTAIEEASAALTAAEKAKTQAVATAASIANLKTTAEAVYAAAQIKQELTASESEGAPQSKHTIACTNIKINSTCTENNCKWDSTTEDKGEHCKPKPGTENTAAAAGKGTAEAEKCKGKLEDACTKDPSCKWENNTCKDSSILVNNQFALSMVSAAFVALLF